MSVLSVGTSSAWVDAVLVRVLPVATPEATWTGTVIVTVAPGASEVIAQSMVDPEAPVSENPAVGTAVAVPAV